MLQYDIRYKIKDSISYHNLKRLPLGDLDEKVFFMIQGEEITVRSEDQMIDDQCWKLSEQIYYKPSDLCVLDRNNIALGTAWRGWQMVDFDTGCDFDHDTIKFCKIKRKKCTLQQHQLLCMNHLQSLFNKHTKFGQPLALSYSQGIDSLVILSYLHKLEYHDKIKLIHFSNRIGGKYDLDFSYEKDLGFDVEIIEFHENDLYDIINTKDVKLVSCYITSWLLRKYPKYNLIFGFHGNQILCHKNIFINRSNSNTVSNEKCQESYLEKYDTGLDSQQTLASHCLYVKPWNYLNSFYDGRLLDIIADKELFASVRNVEWDKVDSKMISNAELARNIIRSNVGNLFEPLITKERLNEIDCVKGNHELLLDKLDQEIFITKATMIHDPVGLKWLKKNLKKGVMEKKINFNTVLSFLNIGRLTKAYK